MIICVAVLIFTLRRVVLAGAPHDGTIHHAPVPPHP